jgi:hypothetical protein
MEALGVLLGVPAVVTEPVHLGGQSS